MSNQPYRIGVLSDFNAQNFAMLLQKSCSVPGAKCAVAPFGQLMQILSNHSAEFWMEPFDALVVWALPQCCVRGFQRVLDCEKFSTDEILAGADTFAALIRQLPDTVRTIIVPSLTVPEARRGLGALDMVNNVGMGNALMQVNLRLAEQFALDRRVVFLDAHRWLSFVGSTAYNPKLWYLSKTPFSNLVFQEAANDVLAALDGICGRNKKVVVLDLDNTLWGGIVGDDGWEKLRLGGHDAIGEAFADFQKGLKRLTNRGILLVIASKNEESTALEAIKRHPEMVLKLEDFAAWRINWTDKAENLKELMAGLNLGLESAVFLDDSAFERGRVREALPQVLVPELPADPLQLPSFLAGLRCFDNPFISTEDRARTAMYAADRARVMLKGGTRSPEEWLEQLELRVEVDTLNEASLDRATQLFNKTNQMNLSTRRLTAPELLTWSRQDGHRVWTFRVADKFGDYGLCGISSFIQEGSRGRLLDFLLSCRVMGRRVEDTMISVVARHAQKAGFEELQAELIPSPKNQPCERWFQNHPAMRREQQVFRLPLADVPQLPAYVRMSGD